MDYRVLGRTGVNVSTLCLGAMNFGKWGSDLDDSVRIVHRALDAGINFIDTADIYSDGESEEIVGKALASSGLREKVVLATKVNGPMGQDPNQGGNSRRWIVQEVDNSLRRLGTDWIDLYQIHRPDPTTEIGETLSVLTDLVAAGKVRYIGSSTFSAHEIVAAQWAADKRGRQRFIAEQPPYSLLARRIEADVLPVCEQYGIGVIPWSPLSGGWLSGRYRKGQVPQSSRPEKIGGYGMAERYDMSLESNQRKLEATEQFAVLAEKAGITLIELALAFALRHRAVTSLVIGPRTVEHLESQLTAVDVHLDDAVLDSIDEIVPPGTTLNAVDEGWVPPALYNPALRRR